jgi:hypothetical protein
MGFDLPQHIGVEHTGGDRIGKHFWLAVEKLVHGTKRSHAKRRPAGAALRRGFVHAGSPRVQ